MAAFSRRSVGRFFTALLNGRRLKKKVQPFSHVRKTAAGLAVVPEWRGFDLVQAATLLHPLLSRLELAVEITDDLSLAKQNFQ